jgi:uncharacterized phage protein (TIGR01671 family)
MNTFTEKTMNRKIKFRVWCKGTSDNLNFNKPRWINPNDFIFRKYYPYFPDLDVDNKHFEIVQFTGLEDKNGREIYEGNIIRVSYKMDELGDTETYVSAVVFEDGAFGDKFDCFFSYSFIPSFQMEVLGNIFENQELLEGAKP